MPYIQGILGNLVHNPELRTTQTGKQVCSFRIANNYGFGDNKRTDYVPCVAWNRNAETIAKYFKKGDPIIVQGEWHNNPFKKEKGANGKEYDVANWEYMVETITFIPKPQGYQQATYDDYRYAPVAQEPVQSNQFDTIDVEDDSIPF